MAAVKTPKEIQAEIQKLREAIERKQKKPRNNSTRRGKKEFSMPYN